VADETPAARIVGIALRHGGCVTCAAQSGASKRRRALREGPHEPGGEPIRKAVVRLLPMNADSRVFTGAATENGPDEARPSK